MKIITFEQIKSLGISSEDCYAWVDEVLRSRDKYKMPTKTKIALERSDYYNVMPCATPIEDGFIGLKVVSRNTLRHEQGRLSLDAQIFLYNQADCELCAVMDGNYITTLRTAAIAVHSCLNFAENYKTIAMVGLGNIGTSIGEILFKKLPQDNFKIKLFKYKDHAERFIERFQAKYPHLSFEICDDYETLMKDSDVVFSSVTFMQDDFCNENIYKPGCTVIPVHMRGFMGCDLTFDHVIASDMERIKEFAYYDKFKKLSYKNDILSGKTPVRENPSDRVIVYDLGLSITDLYFAGKFYNLLQDKSFEVPVKIGPDKQFYM